MSSPPSEHFSPVPSTQFCVQSWESVKLQQRQMFTTGVASFNCPLLHPPTHSFNFSNNLFLDSGTKLRAQTPQAIIKSTAAIQRCSVLARARARLRRGPRLSRRMTVFALAPCAMRVPMTHRQGMGKRQQSSDLLYPGTGESLFRAGSILIFPLAVLYCSELCKNMSLRGFMGPNMKIMW